MQRTGMKLEGGRENNPNCERSLCTQRERGAVESAAVWTGQIDSSAAL